MSPHYDVQGEKMGNKKRKKFPEKQKHNMSRKVKKTSL